MPRAIPFSLLMPGDVSEYLESIQRGQKNKTVIDAIRASDGFKQFKERMIWIKL